MRYLTLLIGALLLAGCARQTPPPAQPLPPPPVQPAPTPPPTTPAPSQPSMPLSASYLRGYNDGYSGKWLGPVSWVVAEDYRAGWDAGQRDRKNGMGHRFEN